MQLVSKSREAPFGAGEFPTLHLLGLFTEFARFMFKSQLKYQLVDCPDSKISQFPP